MTTILANFPTFLAILIFLANSVENHNIYLCHLSFVQGKS
jgi:hypothetical protein